jgi:phage-related minor tail protein
MATLRELIIKISANSQSFQTEISRASRMGQDYYRTMQNGGRQAAARRVRLSALAEVTNQINTAKSSALGWLHSRSICHWSSDFRLLMSGVLLTLV